MEWAIRVEPFKFISFSDLQIVKEVNEHGRAEVSGMVSAEGAAEYLGGHSFDKAAKIFAIDENGSEQLLFNGLVVDFSLLNTGELYRMSLKLLSHSSKMDATRRTRTFQDTKMSYGDITQIMADESGVGRFRFIIPSNARTAIERLFVQYEETDMEFAIRMASRLNTVVVPDFLNDFPYISIGAPSNRAAPNFDASSYTLGFDNQESFFSEGYDPLYCIVRSRNAYEIGSEATFLGRQMIVAKVATSLVGAQLEHTYTLRTQKGFITHEFFNQNLIGGSIAGHIVDVDRDLVKIRIQGDVEQSGYAWFSYATVYSSPNDTGWFFMPERNDEVRLHFPTEREWEGYVISSVHGGGRADADIKSLRTRWGKEVVFSPQSIYINNGAGSNILLDDDEGIKIVTNRAIDITAGSDVKIDAIGKVELTADQGVTISKGDSVISVDDVITISAEHVRVE